MHTSAVTALALRPSGACQTYQSPPQPPGPSLFFLYEYCDFARAPGGVGGCRLCQHSLFQQGVVGAFAEGFEFLTSEFGLGNSQDLGC